MLLGRLTASKRHGPDAEWSRWAGTGSHVSQQVRRRQITQELNPSVSGTASGCFRPVVAVAEFYNPGCRVRPARH